MPTLRGRALPLAGVLALIVAACASTPALPPLTGTPTAERAFEIDGRLSARRGDDAITLAFVWKHSAIRDEFVVTTPLGQAVAELTSEAATRRVEVRTADGRHDEANDWPALTERVVGFPLPVGALTWWAQGIPSVGTPHSVETDSAGRTSVLHQDGCDIAYSYADASARLPMRLGLVCRDVEIRIVIERWRAA